MKKNGKRSTIQWHFSGAPKRLPVHKADPRKDGLQKLLDFMHKLSLESLEDGKTPMVLLLAIGLTTVFSLSLLVRSALAAEASLEKKPAAVTSLVNVLAQKGKAAQDPSSKLVSKEGSALPAAKVKAVEVKKAEKVFPKDAKKVEKFVTGTVSYVRKDKIAVEYGASEEGTEEMLVLIGPQLKVGKVKKFSDIAQGDEVEVKYRQVFLEPKVKGGERLVLDTTALEISRLKTAAEIKAEAQQAAAIHSALQPAPTEPKDGDL